MEIITWLNWWSRTMITYSTLKALMSKLFFYWELYNCWLIFKRLFNDQKRYCLKCLNFDKCKLDFFPLVINKYTLLACDEVEYKSCIEVILLAFEETTLDLALNLIVKNLKEKRSIRRRFHLFVILVQDAHIAEFLIYQFLSFCFRIYKYTMTMVVVSGVKTSFSEKP